MMTGRRRTRAAQLPGRNFARDPLKFLAEHGEGPCRAARNSGGGGNANGAPGRQTKCAVHGARAGRLPPRYYGPPYHCGSIETENQ